MKITRTHGQQGFTLIEIMGVVVILGILAAVVVPREYGTVEDDLHLDIDSSLELEEDTVALVDGILDRGALSDYRIAHAARADLCRRLGRKVDARQSYERAIELAKQEPERRFIEGRLRVTLAVDVDPISSDAAGDARIAGEVRHLNLRRPVVACIDRRR